MSEVSNFAAFYNNYKTGTRNNSANEPAKLDYYTEQKLLWMAMQIEHRQLSVEYLIQYRRHAVRMTGNFCIYKYGPFYIIYMRNGCVFIENPSDTRRAQLMHNEFVNYTICNTSDRIISYNSDYIVSESGMIIFRDVHDEFYNLQYQGNGYAAIAYALNVLGVQ